MNSSVKYNECDIKPEIKNQDKYEWIYANFSYANKGQNKSLNNQLYRSQCTNSLIMIQVQAIVQLIFHLFMFKITQLVFAVIILIPQMQSTIIIHYVSNNLNNSMYDMRADVTLSQCLLLVVSTICQIESVILHIFQPDSINFVIYLQGLEIIKIDSQQITHIPKNISQIINTFFPTINFLISYFKTQKPIQIMMILINLIVNQAFQLKNNSQNENLHNQLEEQEFRTKTSQSTMHDMRNYLYTSIVFMKEQLNLFSKTMRGELFNILESDIYVLENMKYLQNIDLLFNKIYQIRLDTYETSDVQSWSNKKLKLLIMNKNFSVQSFLNKNTIRAFIFDKVLLNTALISIMNNLSESKGKNFKIIWSNLNIFFEENNELEELDEHILRIDISAMEVDDKDQDRIVEQNQILIKIHQQIQTNTKEVRFEVLRSKMGISMLIFHSDLFQPGLMNMSKFEEVSDSRNNESDFSILNDMIHEENSYMSDSYNRMESSGFPSIVTLNTQKQSQSSSSVKSNMRQLDMFHSRNSNPTLVPNQLSYKTSSKNNNQEKVSKSQDNNQNKSQSLSNISKQNNNQNENNKRKDLSKSFNIEVGMVDIKTDSSNVNSMASQSVGTNSQSINQFNFQKKLLKNSQNSEFTFEKKSHSENSSNSGPLCSQNSKFSNNSNSRLDVGSIKSKDSKQSMKQDSLKQTEESFNQHTHPTHNDKSIDFTIVQEEDLTDNTMDVNDYDHDSKSQSQISNKISKFNYHKSPFILINNIDSVNSIFEKKFTLYNTCSSLIDMKTMFEWMAKDEWFNDRTLVFISDQEQDIKLTKEIISYINLNSETIQFFDIQFVVLTNKDNYSSVNINFEILKIFKKPFTREQLDKLKEMIGVNCRRRSMPDFHLKKTSIDLKERDINPVENEAIVSGHTQIHSPSLLFKNSIKQNLMYERSQFINVDDEENILKMHTRIFKKQNIILNTCRCGNDLYQMLKHMSQDSYQNGLHILIIMDYKLVDESGDQIIVEARKRNVGFGLAALNLEFVALSSTEDRNVIDIFEKLNVTVYQKPLKSNMITKFKEKIGYKRIKRHSLQSNELDGINKLNVE